MSYDFTPLGNFIGSSDRSPLSRSAYEALSRSNRSETSPAPKNNAVPKHTVSTDGQRDAFVNSLLGKFSGAGLKPMLDSLVPSAKSLGGSYGLYAGVGELPAYKVKSLIDGYV